MHLTNYSVNKKSAAFQANQSTDEEGGCGIGAQAHFQ
jgi:hypothetical protein